MTATPDRPAPADDPTAIAARLAERYPPAPVARRAAVPAAIVATLVVVAVSIWFLRSAPEITAQVVGYDPVNATTTTVRVAVTKPVDADAECTVAVQSADGRVTGSAVVEAPAGAVTRTVTAQVRTLQAGVYATVADCRLT